MVFPRGKTREGGKGKGPSTGGGEASVQDPERERETWKGGPDPGEFLRIAARAETMARKLVPNQADAEIVAWKALEVYLKGFGRGDLPQNPARRRGWIKGVLRSLAYAFLKGRRGMRNLGEEIFAGGFSAEDSLSRVLWPQGYLDRLQEMRVRWEALFGDLWRSLTPVQRVVLGRVIEASSIREAARKLGMWPENVRNIMAQIAAKAGKLKKNRKSCTPPPTRKRGKRRVIERKPQFSFPAGRSRKAGEVGPNGQIPSRNPIKIEPSEEPGIRGPFRSFVRPCSPHQAAEEREWGFDGKIKNLHWMLVSFINSIKRTQPRAYNIKNPGTGA